MNQDNEYDRELRRLTQYADQTLSNVVKGMLTSIFAECPEDPVEVRAPLSSAQSAICIV